MFATYDGSAPRELVAAEEGAFLALPDYELTILAFITFYTGRLSGRFWRQDVAVLVNSQDGFTVR